MTTTRKTIKELLESYFCNQKEIELLKHQIEDEKNKTELAGSYQYCDDFTGQQRERTIMKATGDLPTITNLAARRNMLIEECKDVDRLVFNIPDGRMRQVLYIGYIMTDHDWEKVADHFGRDRSGEAYRKKAARYLEKYAYASQVSKMS